MEKRRKELSLMITEDIKMQLRSMNVFYNIKFKEYYYCLIKIYKFRCISFNKLEPFPSPFCKVTYNIKV